MEANDQLFHRGLAGKHKIKYFNKIFYILNSFL